MLILRLSRAGTKKRPVYHLVATDSRSRRDGRFVENLGYYIPGKNVISFRQDRVEYWAKNGAAISPLAKRLIKMAKKAPAPVAPVKKKTPANAAAQAAKPADAAS
jgi:small subunit ribosomal protein S16